MSKLNGKIAVITGGMGGVGRPEEMASAVLYLASDDSSYSTGVDLVADGGMSQV